MDKMIVAGVMVRLTDVSEGWRDEEGKSQVENPVACSRHAYTLGPVSQREDFRCVDPCDRRLVSWSAKKHRENVRMKQGKAYPGDAVDANKNVAACDDSFGRGSALDLPRQDRVTINRVHFVAIGSHQGTDDEMQQASNYGAVDCDGRVSK